jgi:hypothetical protein
MIQRLELAVRLTAISAQCPLLTFGARPSAGYCYTATV